MKEKVHLTILRFSVVAVLIAVTAIVSCTKDKDKTVAGKLNAPGTVTIDAAGGSKTFAITANLEWTVSGHESVAWLNISPSSGSGNETITATATENTAETAREAELTISATGVGSVKVKVIQQGTAPATPLSIDQDPEDVDIYVGGDATFTVAAIGGEGELSYQWQSYDDDGEEWYDLEDDTGIEGTTTEELTLQYLAISWSGAQFRCIVTDENDDSVTSETATLSVMNYLLVDVASLSFEGEGGDEEIIITTSTDWCVSADLGVDWLTFTPEEGEPGVITVKVTAKPNSKIPRETKIVVGGTEDVDIQEILVYQEGDPTSDLPYLDVTMTSLSFTSSAGAKEFTVESNVTGWAVSSSAAWCTVSPATGSNNAPVTVTVTANTGAGRTATITVSKAGVEPQKITVTQSANRGGLITGVSVDPDLLKFGVTASTKQFTVEANPTQAWTATSSAAWCTITPSSGPGTKTVDVSVTANSGIMKPPRTATITITYTLPLAKLPQTITVEVKQDGAIATVIDPILPTDPGKIKPIDPIIPPIEKPIKVPILKP